MLAALLAGVARAAAPVSPADPPVTEVKVERVRPQREKLPTLRFLKENRAFFRARLDALRQAPRRGGGEAGAIDPRFLAYQRMLADVGAARDSVAGIDQDRRGRELFASISDLGRLESQLDQMDRLLADQRVRLGALQGDFTGLQRTALAIVLSGYPRSAEVSSLSITLEDGAALVVPISADQRGSLQHGGLLQVFHGLVEPRSQVVEITLSGERWPRGDSGFVALEPARDRLTLLRLDLSAVQPAGGASGIAASTWLQDAGLRASAGTRSEP
ncbi:MAG TPA: hypothetical protein VI792_08620 [Candidatus Eisenbacteria bacterium]